MTTNRKILVVEDDKKIAETVKLYLERDGYEVIIASDGREALTAARVKKPALIILDLMLPQLGGLEVCRILRDESDAYIIMLTARTTEQDKLNGLATGADDYITKPFSPRELVARVCAVLRRKRKDSAEAESPALTVRDLQVNVSRREVSVGGKMVNLTAAEFKLLETLARSPERVFTRSELVERAFGYDYEGLERTVDAHIMNLRKKIQFDRQKPPLIKTVFGVGYKISAQNDVS